MMLRITSLVLVIFLSVEISFAVQCNTNPCLLGGLFDTPQYQCLQIADNLNDVLCTCPDGQAELNSPCRVCAKTECGYDGICLEMSFFENLFYACACKNGTLRYLNPGPCPDPNQTTPPFVSTTQSGICLNGGIYDAAIGTCICQAGFTGLHCEILPGQANCKDVTCANGGVCNPVPTTENGIDIQCTCPNGFAGSNCELVGFAGRCRPDLCTNGGTCIEKSNGASTYAYCQCPPGVTGPSCQTPYFSCPAPGTFADSINCKYGRYFQCVGLTLSTLSCPRGLRYNFMKMRCDTDVSCPP